MLCLLVHYYLSNVQTEAFYDEFHIVRMQIQFAKCHYAFLMVIALFSEI